MGSLILVYVYSADFEFFFLQRKVCTETKIQSFELQFNFSDLPSQCLFIKIWFSSMCNVSNETLCNYLFTDKFPYLPVTWSYYVIGREKWTAQGTSIHLRGPVYFWYLLVVCLFLKFPSQYVLTPNVCKNHFIKNWSPL